MMKLSIMTLGLVAVAAVAFADIADLAWNQSNIQTLRELDKSAVATLVNELRDTSGRYYVLRPVKLASLLGPISPATAGINW